MASTTRGAARPRVLACDGCLGNRRCWVCLGSGHAVPERLLGTCGRCSGSGVCDLCAVPRQREAAS